MKTLWIEDNKNARSLLLAAGDAATRERLNVDLVVADSLLDAEKKLRLERFDLVVVDLRLPDSIDEDATLTRVASMGEFRLAVVSASERRQDLVDGLVEIGQNCAKKAVAKENVNFGDFVKQPKAFHKFLTDLTTENAASA